MGVGAGVGVNVGCGAGVAVACGVDVAAGETGVLVGEGAEVFVGGGRGVSAGGIVVAVGCGAAVGVAVGMDVGSSPQAIAATAARVIMNTTTAFLNPLRLLKVPIIPNPLLMEYALHKVPAGPLVRFFLQPVHQPVFDRLLYVEDGLDKLGRV